MESAVPTGEAKASHTGQRIVLPTFGSLGNLRPNIALALGLQARGHEALIATTRQRIEARGVGFHAVRPDGPDLDHDRDAMRRIMDFQRIAVQEDRPRPVRALVRFALLRFDRRPPV